METHNNTRLVSWTAEPNGRGTWSLLSSCLITMGLCVYTAMHLNIPSQPSKAADVGRWRRICRSEYRKQAQWLLMGLFAPELVVYTAWNQFIFVKNMTGVMADRGHKVPPGRDPS